MWNIFFKDLREKFWHIVFSLLLLPIVPLISSILFKDYYEDAKISLYFVLFDFYLPIYLSLLSSSIFSDENLNLLKNMPIPFWKIITSKLLFLFLNYLILSFSFFSFLYNNIAFKEIFSHYVIPFFYFDLFLVFLSFTLSNIIIKKSISIAFSFFLYFINYFYFIFILKKTNLFLLLKIEIYIFYFLLLFITIIFSYYTALKKILNSKLKISTILLSVIIFLSPSIYLFFQKDKILFQYNTSVNCSFYPINENKILISSYTLDETYIYDIKSKNFKYIPQLYKVNYGYVYDKNKIYYFTASRNFNICNLTKKCYLWYSFDFKKNKAQKIGFYPYWSIFTDKFIIWHGWTKIPGNNEIGIINRENKNCFYDLCETSVFLKEGAFYKKAEEKNYFLYYVDYSSFQKKVLLEGDFRLYYVWHQVSGLNYCYILKDKKLFKIFYPPFEIKEIGEYQLFIDFENGYYLTKRKEKNKIKIYLFKNENFIKEKEFYYDDIWGGFGRRQNFAGITIIKSNKVVDAILAIENDDFKIYELPESTYYYFFKSNEEIILIKNINNIFSLNFQKPVIYNFKNGKERAL